MSFVFIDRADRSSELERALQTGGAIALDCEAAGFHRYSDRLCLVQLTTAEGDNFIVDPLAFDIAPLLRRVLEDPAVPVLMHGSDYDLRLLDRDLDIRLQGLVDTQAAAALLGESALGLAALLEKFLGVQLEKKYQRADWAIRPLPTDMLDYAASDTRYLHELVRRLEERLAEAQRGDWAQEEYRALEAIRWEDDSGIDPVTRVKKVRDLSPREVDRLREALTWRDSIAQELDRAAFRVASDETLADVASERPRSLSALADIKGMNARLAHDRGSELLERLDAVDARPDTEVIGYPRRERGSGLGRPAPEIEELADRLKQVRNQKADELGLARGTLLSNAMLVEIARQAPRSAVQLAEVPGLKRWQREVIGSALLETLAKNQRS
jgi:ribonuclease D